MLSNAFNVDCAFVSSSGLKLKDLNAVDKRISILFSKVLNCNARRLSSDLVVTMELMALIF